MTTDVQTALETYASNYAQLETTLTAAGGNAPFILRDENVQNFMRSLAANNIVIAAQYNGPKVKPKAPRKPRSDAGKKREQTPQGGGSNE